MTHLTDPLLSATGVAHGFGARGAADPEGLARPRQVHGTDVVSLRDCRGRDDPPAADAIISNEAGQPIAVVTADCVPILIATSDGAAVAAIHAGWRGLAAGVVEAGLAALLRLSAGGPDSVRVAIGPHIGRCCYEVDAPVLVPLAARFGEAFERHREPVAGRPGHAHISLGGLAREELSRLGVPEPAVSLAAADCTHCDSERFHSYRRDGPRAGRLVHFIASRDPSRAGPGDSPVA